jgi:O-methyltransferase involved in polyketide biosynthesis
VIDLSPVSSTSLLTLYARAISGLFDDPASAAVVARVDEALAGSPEPLHRALLARKLPGVLVADVAWRARRFDREADAFLAESPAGLVVELGCGVDTRCERVARGRGDWLAFDLPGVVALREVLLAPEPRRTTIAADLSDPAWMDRVPAGRPALFLAEGLLPYLPQAAVDGLVAGLAARFPGAVLLADVFPRVAARMLDTRYGRWKVKRQLHMSGSLPILSGLSGSRDWEALAPGVRFVDEWSFLDEPDLKPGWLRATRGLPGMRHVHWVVRYRLGEAPGSRSAAVSGENAGGA